MAGYCIVSFSGRKDGNCSRIADVVKNVLAAQGDVSEYSFSEIKITSCGNCGYECFSAREKCLYAADSEYELCKNIAESECSYLIVPNYCDYPCANFFIFNERSQCYFQGHEELLNEYLAAKKRFIVISNTNEDNFRNVFRQHVQEGSEPEVLFLSAKRYGRRSVDGDLMEEEQARQAVIEFI
ncbi:MAG: hypothetical protein IJZ85_05570 [Lachnospiraceae bacterium]|nr:hypothetical protein [Lachnospiraceae bacterium]